MTPAAGSSAVAWKWRCTADGSGAARFVIRTTARTFAAETVGGVPIANLKFDPVVETATSEIVYKFNWGH